MNVFEKGPVRYLISRGNISEKNFQQKKGEFLETIRGAVLEGIELVQLREKRLGAAQLFDLASEAVQLTRGTGVRILVNDRFDIALAAGADGVHLTSRSIPVAVVRQRVGTGIMIGASTHSRDDVAQAAASGADFALLGNVFATPGKGSPLGLDALREICSAAAPFPVVAVGGIDANNYGSVLGAGCSGYAAIRYLNDFVIISA